MENVMLKIENLTKIYKGDQKAVDSVNLDISAGDIYGFIGHNGAGKTTTIKCVVGILDFEQGNITIDGMNIKDKPIECKKIMAYIPDESNIYDNLTGIQFLEFISDIYGLDANKKRENIEKYSQAFEMKENLSAVISSYSHGMKQKLMIISALIHEPKLLVLDEPFVGLDPKASHTLKEMMRDICNNGGAIFFSTHVLEVAQKLCNKISIIKQGKIVVQGPTEQIVQDKTLEDVFLELVEENKENE